MNAWNDVLTALPVHRGQKNGEPYHEYCISERNDYLTVIVYRDGSKRITISTFSHNGNWISPTDEIVTHWLPLPEYPTLHDELQAMHNVLK